MVKKTRANNASLSKLTAVTPRSMAYAAVQVGVRAVLKYFVSIKHSWKARFMLCATEQWNQYDGEFDMYEFFIKLAELFESDPDGTWAVETLKWWNA
jgi:hypothetical protein